MTNRGVCDFSGFGSRVMYFPSHSGADESLRAPCVHDGVTLRSKLLFTLACLMLLQHPYLEIELQPYMDGN